MRLATWQIGDIKTLNRFDKKDLEQYKEVNFINRDEYSVWCIKAETLEELITNSLFTAVRFPEKLYIFEIDDYIVIDKSEWYRDVSNQRYNKEPLKLENYIISEERNLPKEYLVKNIPRDAICLDVSPENIEVFNQRIKDVFQWCQNEFNSCYKKPIYSNFYKSAELSNENRNAFIKYLLPLQWSYKIEYSDNDAYIKNEVNWKVAEIISKTFICQYANNESDFINEALYDFYLWDSETLNWTVLNYEKVWVKCRKKLKNNVGKTFSALNEHKIGRNDLCPCGSTKKVKFCHPEIL